MSEFTPGRRDFLKAAATIAAGVGLGSIGGAAVGQSQPDRPLKACQFGMLPKELADIGRASCRERVSVVV